MNGQVVFDASKDDMKTYCSQVKKETLIGLEKITLAITSKLQLENQNYQNSVTVYSYYLFYYFHEKLSKIRTKNTSNVKSINICKF